MDLFSHAFWTIVLYKIFGEKTKRRFNLKIAAFWGVFPDLFAFGIPLAWFVLDSISSRARSFEPANISPVINFTMTLYSASHSLIVFALASSALALTILLNRRFSFSQKLRRIPWEFSAWLLHILIDIPTHSFQFYATPFLWPLSDFKINGLTWRNPWFFVVNYLLIIIVYFIVLRKKKIGPKLADSSK